MTAAYRRREMGWLRADGEAFLERGAPMTNGNPAWLIWIRALDTEIVRDTLTSGHVVTTARDGGDPCRRLSELLLVDPVDGEDDPWFIHRGDEGWFLDAKIAAEYHVACRDAKARP